MTSTLSTESQFKSISVRRLRFARSMSMLFGLVGIVTCIGCNHSKPTGFLAKGGTIEATPYEGMWRKGTEGSFELMHLVFLPRNSSGVVVSAAGFDRKPKPNCVSSYPEGLFSDGKRIVTGPNERVFVYKEDRTMVLIPLNAVELAALSPNDFDRLPKTKLWKDKVRPALEKEVWTGR